jgi:RNA polymerase sigma factor (sigma-70 family)
LSPLALSLRFLQTQSDEQLAALARAGHERAFEALVRRYRRPLLAYCRRIGSPQTNPEDILQQGLLQAWSAIRTGVEVREPRAWLYRIVHNVSISNHRRPVLVPVEMRDTAGANGADFEAEQRMAARDALAGLAALPDLQREVMVGTAVDGMSHEELASALGLSSGAVRGLIYRGRDHARPADLLGVAQRLRARLRLLRGSGRGRHRGDRRDPGQGRRDRGDGRRDRHRDWDLDQSQGSSRPRNAGRSRGAAPRREPTGIRRLAPGARGRPDELAHRLRSRIGPAEFDVAELGAGKQRRRRV